MERELRLKAFIDEYVRVAQLFDDIVSMKESMGRLEMYMVVIVCQIGAMSLFLLFRFCRAQRNSGEYHLEHRFERNPSTVNETKSVP
uniref:GOLD domain-containing protein n=1 Tax=Angiostrongylus cantonensis TaxID=6313 RepID=A0A0K0DGX3_ANGCA